mgnify:CR=1 FL=1
MKNLVVITAINVIMPNISSWELLLFCTGKGVNHHFYNISNSENQFFEFPF